MQASLKDYPNVYKYDKTDFVALLNEMLLKYEINGPYHKAHFLSQCLHESAHLDTTLEFGSGVNYDLADMQTLRKMETQR